MDTWSKPKGSILIVDDDEINAKVLSRMVELSGYRTFVVGNGAEALDALSVAGYDAILMDCHMPVMDGYEATKAIRAGERPGRRIPIIAVTAGAFPNDKERCIEAGMDDYIAKPVMQGVLATALAKLTTDEPPTALDMVDGESTTAPIDLERINQLEATLGEEFLPVLASFCTSTSERIEAIDVAINDGNEDELRRLTHSLAGSARTFGADGIAEAANLLKLSLSIDDRTLWADSAWRLRSQYNDLRRALSDKFETAGIQIP